jgi:uncharacterized protein
MMQDVPVRGEGKELASMLVGNVHLLPLPGSHNYAGGGLRPIIKRALAEAQTLVDAGFDAMLLQNAGDGRFKRDGSPETIAYMTAIGAELGTKLACRVGINVLSVGSTASLAIAHALGADFVRIKVYVGAVVGPSGTIDGSYEEALDFREHIDATDVAITADVFDRSSWHLGDWPIGDAARCAHEEGGAEVLIITGGSLEESLARAQAVRAAVPSAPLWCGGGTTPDNIAEMLGVYDGAIVGVGIKPDGDIKEQFSSSLARAYVKAGRAAQQRG